MHAQIRRHRVRRGARGPRVPVFFFNDTATTEIYTLSLHDALPILPKQGTKNGSHTPNGASTISWNPTKVQSRHVEYSGYGEGGGAVVSCIARGAGRTGSGTTV